MKEIRNKNKFKLFEIKRLRNQRRLSYSQGQESSLTKELNRFWALFSLRIFARNQKNIIGK